MEKKERTRKTELASYIMLCFFAAWNVCFFLPMDIYIPNANDIEIPIKPLILCLGIVTLAVFAVALAVCLLTKGKANRIYRAALFGVSTAFYIQGNFLAANLGEMDGERYTLSFGRTMLSIAVWLAVLAAAFVLLWKLPEEFDGLSGRIAEALFIVQVIALGVSAYNSIPKYNADKLNFIFEGETVAYCSMKDLDVYSTNKNVIILIADEYDSYLFDGTMEEAPETLSEFDGFTYYINALGRYSLTRPSIAYFTSGGADNDAYTDLTFYESAAENYKANFYSATNIPPASVMEQYCDNVGAMDLTFGEAMIYAKDVIRLAFFRCMPEPLKPPFWFDGKIGVNLSDDLENRLTAKFGAGQYEFENLAFYNKLPRELVKTDENVFKFIYTQGVHSIRIVTKDLEYIPDQRYELSPQEEAIAVNKILNEYLRILKENGVYDNSEIVIMADHGFSGHLDKMYPLFMYKPAHQTETGIKISKAPISYDEMFSTYKMLAGADPGGRTVFDIAEGEQRVRLYDFENTEITETEKPRGPETTRF